MVTVTNAAAADLRAGPNPPQLFVSVQVEVAWGRLIGQTPYQGIEADFRDFPFLDLLGLSSYPYFGWADPADLPDDYYSRLLTNRPTQVMIVEGGWASGSAGSFVTTPAKQAAYFRRQTRLLAKTNPVAWLQLAPTDIDVAAFPVALQASIMPFATLGVFDALLRPKPALAVWDSLFGVPYRP